MLFPGRLLSKDRSVSGLIMDLSANGARVELARPLEAASPLTLQLAGSVHFDVEVAWRDGKHLGLRFHDVPARIASILSGLLPEDCLAAA